MSFNLLIRVGGLCMLVPDERQRVHVLMPATDSLVHCGIDQHVPRLGYYDPPSPRIPANFHVVLIPSSRFVIESHDCARTPRGTTGIQNVSRLFDPHEPVLPDILVTDGAIDARLSAHLVIKGGQVAGTSPDKGRWDCFVPRGRRYRKTQLIMAPWVVWAMKMQGHELNLEDMQTAGGAKIPALRPDGPFNIVYLELMHMPVRETMEPMGPEPALGAPAYHFRAFYPLVGREVSEGPLPTWDRLLSDTHKKDGPATAHDESERTMHEHPEGMSPYTCMTGGGDT